MSNFLVIYYYLYKFVASRPDLAMLNFIFDLLLFIYFFDRRTAPSTKDLFWNVIQSRPDKIALNALINVIGFFVVFGKFIFEVSFTVIFVILFTWALIEDFQQGTIVLN